MKENYLNERIKLIKKMDKKRDYEPTDKELEKAYGYLDFCYECGKPITFWDRFFSFNSIHTFFGNCHKRCPK